MRITKDYRKQAGMGLWYNSKLRKAKAKVHRPGCQGKKPWTTTFHDVLIEEARQQYWAFRKY